MRQEINIIWIGDESKQPLQCIDSWRKHHDVKVWGNQELTNLEWPLEDQMKQIKEINGLADMMRWQLLYQHGGVFVDADSYCVKRLPGWIWDGGEYACWESELKRPDLIACGFLAFPAKSPLIAAIINRIKRDGVNHGMAWETVGTKIISKTWREMNYKNLVILPSQMFIPRHFSEEEVYQGSAVHAIQHWGATFNFYGADTL